MILKTKKILAREFLLILASFTCVFLFWLILLIRNQYFDDRNQKSKNEIKLLSNQIGNIEFPYLIQSKFNDLIWQKKVANFNENEPVPYEKGNSKINSNQPYQTDPILQRLNKEWVPPAHDEIIESSDYSDKNKDQIKTLYRLLVFLKFPFDSLGLGFVPLYDSFKDGIRNELLSNTRDKTELKRIYRFLKDEDVIKRKQNQYILSVEFNAFESSLGPEKSEIPKELEKQIERLEVELRNLKDEQKNLPNKILTYQQIQTFVINAGMIILFIVFPVRLLLISIIWAVRILK